MVEERITDGPLGPLSVTDADPDVEPSADGARAYDVTADGGRLATVHVHEERAHVAFRQGQESALETAQEGGLRTRPKAVDPPQTLVFVESGAEVKRATDVLSAAWTALDESHDSDD